MHPKIITAFGSDKLKITLGQLEKYGFIIILILLWSGVLNFLMSPLYKIIFRLINNHIPPQFTLVKFMLYLK